MSGFASIRIRAAQVLAILAAFSAIVASSAQAHEEDAAAAGPRADWGMVYRGLERATSGPCKGGYVVEVELLGPHCTHGPDPFPAVSGLTGRAPFSRYLGPAKPVPCIGDGDSGPRIELIYAHAADQPDNYAEAAPQMVEIAEEITSAMEESAAETGGFRTLRFETSGCQPVVRDVTLTTAGDDDLSATANDLASLGFNRADRDYLIFVDASVYCGIAFFGFHYARVDRLCWSAHTALHELTHTFGAVYDSAPNASGGSHCTDEYDVMCYSDEPYYPPMRYVCPAEHERLLDCHHDDYFSTDPQPGNFLFANPDLNAAESPFLAMRDGEPATFLPELTDFYYEGPQYAVRAYNADDELCVYGEGAAVARRVRLFCVAYLSERTADVTGALVALAGSSGTARLRLVGTDGGGGRTFGFTVSENGNSIFDEHDGVAGVQSSNRPLGAVDPSTGQPVFYEHVLDVSLMGSSKASRRGCSAAKARVRAARRALAASDRNLRRRYRRLKALWRHLRGHGSAQLARRYAHEYRAYRRALRHREVRERRLRALRRAAAARCSR
jgi:hypothetical protein